MVVLVLRNTPFLNAKSKLKCKYILKQFYITRIHIYIYTHGERYATASKYTASTIARKITDESGQLPIID
jgi:hypothetical protein